jgi:hypothetical protein
VMPLQILKNFREQMDVILQPDLLANFDQMFAPHGPVFRIMQKQIGQLPALLDEVDICQSGDPFAKAIDAHQFAQHNAGVVEAQRLVEIADKKIVPRFSLHPSLFSPFFEMKSRLAD